MSIRIICVGKLRERWQKEACAEYLKRLSRYGKYEVVEVDDEREPDKPSDTLIAKLMDIEGERLLRQIRADDYAVALAIGGESPDSEGIARMMSAWEREGRNIALIIGGSSGLSPAALTRADAKLSLSRLTFPHALARVVLLEQLYRGEKIRAGERYHK